MMQKLFILSTIICAAHTVSVKVFVPANITVETGLTYLV